MQARLTLAVLLVCALTAGQVQAQASDTEEQLARQLSNPVASLVSVPLQLN